MKIDNLGHIYNMIGEKVSMNVYSIFNMKESYNTWPFMSDCFFLGLAFSRFTHVIIFILFMANNISLQETPCFVYPVIH